MAPEASGSSSRASLFRLHIQRYLPLSPLHCLNLLYILSVPCLVIQSCLTLCDPTDYSPPGSSVHEVFPARILEWVAMSSSRGSSPHRDQTQVSCIARQILYH